MIDVTLKSNSSVFTATPEVLVPLVLNLTTSLLILGLESLYPPLLLLRYRDIL